MVKIFKILLFIFVINSSLFTVDNYDLIVLSSNSAILTKIFLFYFPFSKKITPYFSIQHDYFNVELLIKKEYIFNEPSTPVIFDQDVVIRIDNVPFDRVGNISLPVSLRINKKILSKNVSFRIKRNGNKISLRGEIKDIFIGDISDAQYFRKRKNWEFPFLFDLSFIVKDNISDFFPEKID